MSEQKKDLTEHQKLLLEAIKMDPLIAKAEEKLKRLSQDPEVVAEYRQREEELRKRRQSDKIDN